MSSKRRVLWPPSLVNVFPCMGSQTHTTGWPSASTARTIGGSSPPILSAPNLVMSVSRPGRRSGFRRSQIATTSSGVQPAPTLAPTGLLMPERNSRWAPSSWRVRSPTQTMWAEQSYQSPVSESTRVRHSS